MAVDLPKPEPKQWALIYGTTPYKQAIETEKVINGIGEGFVAFHSFPPESMHQTVKLYFVAPLWQKDHVRNSMIKDGYVFEAV